MVITGLERILRTPELLRGSGRLGLLYNQASVDLRFHPAPEMIDRRFPGRLTALFGPQHGATGSEQDNMIETDHAVHPRLGLPVYSLYSSVRRPAPDMLSAVDTVLVDIQDVGTRVYTFATTVLYLMEACARQGTKVVILDRPNPINGVNVEGNILDPRYASFVGPYPIPMRHGLTVGELMSLYNRVHGIGCDLEVILASGWDRRSYFEETGLPWVMPSPNMPLVETAVVYPGQVMLEGTRVSEGRGTTRPFEIFGAPYLDPDAVRREIDPAAIEGVTLREVHFKPTFNKWSGEVCRGLHMHVTDRGVFRPYRTSLAILSAIMKVHPEMFGWSDPPYEYVTDRMPIDVILGDMAVRTGLEAGRSVFELEREWAESLTEFMSLRSRFLLYSPI